MKNNGSTSQLHIPDEVSRVTEGLEKAGFQAYLVGGCVRDILLGLKPKDWDVTTNATPEKIIGLFENTYYNNNYGTVGVVSKSETSDQTVKIVEVTPYRMESAYSDNRRPDNVQFSDNLEDDLKRRDFTINALALLIKRNGDAFETKLVDPFNGLAELQNGIIKAVGDPEQRFKEDALRLLRAIRIAADLGFKIEEKTFLALKKDSELIKNISIERIRDEFTRILMTNKPKLGIILAHQVNLLPYFLPELENCIGVEQNQAHSFDVFEHLVRSADHAASKGWPLEVRLAALFHDIAKPPSRRWDESKKDWTFHGHEVMGAKLVEKILTRLKYPKEMVGKVKKLVRWHMFFSDTEQITLSAVRRMVVNVGTENIWDLMNVRICDRIGTGRPKENPYRLRKYKAMIEEALRAPISVSMLKIDGNTLINELSLEPGPKIGYILHALLEEVLDDPAKNTEQYLKQKAQEMALLSPDELKQKGQSGVIKKQNEENEAVSEIRKKHFVE